MKQSKDPRRSINFPLALYLSTVGMTLLVRPRVNFLLNVRLLTVPFKTLD